MRNITNLLVSVSAMGIATTAFAQEASQPTTPMSAKETYEDEIVVQARRRDESQQDVPLMVQAVTADTLTNLNIREFSDIQTLAPGLSLTNNANGIGGQASLRGVAFDVTASGNNGTVEFYMNDAPISAGVLFQSMFDVGQIEILRGPQGTLRGRASPSGSITVTTRRPDISEAGATMVGTINDIGGWNGQAAINVPIIADKLGLRIAGVVDENDGNEVRSLNNPAEPYINTVGGRISLRAEPVDWLSLNGSYMTTERKALQFDQTESVSIADPSAPASPTLVTASQRAAVGVFPRTFTQRFKVFNWQAQARFAGQKLDYVGSNTKQTILSVDPLDRGNFYDATFPAALRALSQNTASKASQTTHELRLSNDERVFGMFDYVIGALHNKLDSPTSLTTQTPLFVGIANPAFTPTPASFQTLITVPITRGSSTVEKSLFGNVTAHITDATEISGGLRYINYESSGFLTINGVPVPAAAENRKFNHVIYSASIKHNFTDDLMVYASYGSSWRPGSATNPTILRDNIAPGALLSSFYYPDPETSDSFEIGFKSEWFDRRLRLNVSAYHQKFQNYIFSARRIFYAGTDATGVNRVFQTNPAIAVGVPAKVQGVEAEVGFRATPNWTIDATVSYSMSKIQKGRVPCNDYFPRDGIPDNTSQVPTYDQILAANGGEQVAVCNVNYRAGTLPPFAATIQSDFQQPISNNVNGYLRGLVTYYGNSQNDPAVQFDDIKNYAIVNLFAGIRDPDGAWDVGVYVKNLFEVNRILTREPTALSSGYQQLFCPPAAQIPPQLAQVCPTGPRTIGGTATSTYRSVTYTPPREFGLTARFAFGSR